MNTTKPAGNRNLQIGAIILVAVIAVAAAAYFISRRNSQAGPVGPAGPEVTTVSGLKMQDLKVGDGANPKSGQTVTVHYIGWLANGTEFNNSHTGGRPVDFQLAPTGLIQGWYEGLMTMKVGGKRKLWVPSSLAYGPQGRPPVIPPNSDLVFEIELLGVK